MVPEGFSSAGGSFQLHLPAAGCKHQGCLYFQILKTSQRCLDDNSLQFSGEFQLWDAGSDCWLQGGAAPSPLLPPIALCPNGFAQFGAILCSPAGAIGQQGKAQPRAVPWAGLCRSDLVLIAHNLKM